MKTEIKKIDGTRREISIEVAGDVVKNKFEDVFKKLAQEAKVPGFRPGHAPRDILEKRYSSAAQDQVLKELVPDAYGQALKKEGLDAIGLPEISEVKLERSSLSFKATVEVSPQVPVSNYKGQKISYKSITVSAEEIKRGIDSLREARKADAGDNDFARGLGYPSLAELEKAMEKQIFLQKESQQRQRIENEILENLTRGLDFKIPQSLISRQLQDLVRQAKINLAMKGLPREKIEEQEKEITKELEPEAKRQVKVYLVLAEIAKRENIPQDEHMPQRVIEFLLREADWQPIS